MTKKITFVKGIMLLNTKGLKLREEYCNNLGRKVYLNPTFQCERL